MDDTDQEDEILLPVELEESVLTGLVWSDELAPQIIIRLKAEDFSSRQYQRVARQAITHLERYGKAPGAHMPELLSRDLTRGSEGQLLRMLLQGMEQVAPRLQSSFVLEHLDDFLETRQIQKAIELASDALQRGELKVAREAIQQQQSIKQEGSPGVYLHEADKMLSFLNRSADSGFTSGVDTLDQFGATPARKTMLLFLAPPKKGKSWFVVNCGKRNLMHRKSVLHITLENSWELTAQRYAQAINAMTSDADATIRVTRFKKDDLQRLASIELDSIEAEAISRGNKEKIARKLKAFERRPKLLIKEFPMSTLTVGQLTAYLDYLERVEKFKPDLLLIDSPNRMAMDSRNLRTDLAQIFARLHGVASSRNMALVCVHHGNRGSATAKTVTSTMSSEDYTVIGIADLIITYSQTSREKTKGLARLLVDGARNARDNFSVMITQAYDIGQFCLDSVYFSKFAAEENSRMTGEKEDDGKS
jgi:replicative DNA helicase